MNLLKRVPTALVRAMSSSTATAPNPLPATFLRGGTSKGIFLNRAHLPTPSDSWVPIFLGIMGSPDAEYGRQLNGMGGGVSSLSKICVVGPPTTEERIKEGVMAEYTFVQVGIRDESIDMSGNCGNLTSVVGVFAVDEGICVLPRKAHETEKGRATVRLFNTNTQKIIDTTFPVTSESDKLTADLSIPETSISGVPGSASRITLTFNNPAGARTGFLLPTTRAVDDLTVSVPTPNGGHQVSHIPASLIDATNPTVFIHSSALDNLFSFPSYVRGGDQKSLEKGTEVLELIRQEGAQQMGLDKSTQAQPKIAVLSDPNAKEVEAGVDIVVHALSMGVLHKAVPMTVGLCIGVGASVEGSIPWRIVQKSRAKRGGSPTDSKVRILHPGGTVDVGAETRVNATGEMEVKSVQVVRTGRRLMKGVVWW